MKTTSPNQATRGRPNDRPTKSLNEESKCETYYLSAYIKNLIRKEIPQMTNIVKGEVLFVVNDVVFRG